MNSGGLCIAESGMVLGVHQYHLGDVDILAKGFTDLQQSVLFLLKGFQDTLQGDDLLILIEAQGHTHDSGHDLLFVADPMTDGDPLAVGIDPHHRRTIDLHHLRGHQSILL